MVFTEKANKIFQQAIRDYHLTDNVDTEMKNPYDRDSIEYKLYMKCWIDTVQWHLEDLIRDPMIKSGDALAIKRRIDHSNQDRTDLVEEIDSYFRQLYSDVTVFMKSFNTLFCKFLVYDPSSSIFDIMAQYSLNASCAASGF